MIEVLEQVTLQEVQIRFQDQSFQDIGWVLFQICTSQTLVLHSRISESDASLKGSDTGADCDESRCWMIADIANSYFEAGKPKHRRLEGMVANVVAPSNGQVSRETFEAPPELKAVKRINPLTDRFEVRFTSLMDLSLYRMLCDCRADWKQIPNIGIRLHVLLHLLFFVFSLGLLLLLLAVRAKSSRQGQPADAKVSFANEVVSYYIDVINHISWCHSTGAPQTSVNNAWISTYSHKSHLVVRKLLKF